MPRLKNRQSQIPNGLKFALPEVGYQSAPFTSFDTIVNQVDNIVRANPGRAQAAKWPTSREEIADWVDDFNARLCQSNGWNDYINDTGEDSPPKHGPPPGRHVWAVAAGANAIAHWIGDGSNPVSSENSCSRAATCKKCPLNQPGDFSSFFERATSEMLRKQVSAFRDEKLETPYDSSLGVCSACYCPMRLKVHFPLKYILEHIQKESYDELHKDCWIIAESKAAVAAVAATAVEAAKPGAAES